MSWNFLRAVRSWLRRDLARPLASRKPAPLTFETLEDRTLLARVSWAVDASGSWGTPADWSTGSVPGPNDDVVINRSVPVTVTIDSGAQAHSLQVKSLETVVLTGTLTVGSASEIDGAFTISGGTLTANGPVGTTGTSQWGGGTIQGSAGLTNTGALTIAGPFNHDLTGTMTNAGTAVQSGADITFDGGAISNAAGAVYDFQSGSLLDHSGALFTNAGTLEKSTGAGTTAAVGVGLTSAGGTVQLQEGTLGFPYGMVGSGGTLDAAAGASLLLAGTVSGTYTGSPAGFVGLSPDSGPFNSVQAGTGGLTLDLAGAGFGWTGAPSTAR
jgi:hypothetical protein